MEGGAKFRVLRGAFFIRSRGVAVVGEPVDRSLRFARAVTVAIPGGPDGDVIEHVPHVESVRLSEPPHELPGLIFRAERGSERAELLLTLLRPGTILTLTGPAVVDPADDPFPTPRLI